MVIAPAECCDAKEHGPFPGLGAGRAVICYGLLALAFVASPSLASEPALPSQGGRTGEVVQRFKCPEAHQGVAVDADHFYAISNRNVGKYDKRTGRQLATWKDAEGGHLKHLNAGVVVDGKLYAAHSTYPSEPRLSSVEIWDTATLEHMGNHSFGEYGGALNWVDWHDDHWWAVFAYYSREPGPDHVRRTTLVKFDPQWRRMAAWVFPANVLERFAPSSNSGGAWGPDGLLYCTGHDHREMYVLQLPKSGSTLEWVETIAMPFPGQAFAWDDSQPGVAYGIDRKAKEVVAARLPQRKASPEK